MLVELHIRNFALIDALAIPFRPGLNVLTGETGAGKSIIIDAIGAALGEKVGSEVIRTGAEQAEVQALFQLPLEHPTWRRMEEMGLSVEEDGSLLLQRVIGVGRSQCRVNGQPVTLGMLREVGEHLVDIHGQHEHQTLLHVRHHLSLLDAIGGAAIAEPLARYQHLYRRWRALREELRTLRWDESEKARRMDLLQFQLEEIQRARLQPGEWEALREERHRLLHAERLASSALRAYEALYEMERGEGKSALDLVGEARREVEAIAQIDPSMAPLLETLETALAALEETARELRRYQESLEFQPGRLEEIEERLALLERLRRKYGATTEEILAYRDRIAAELETLQHSEERIGELEAQLEHLERELAEAAENLSQARRKVSQRLEKAVVEHLQELRMERVRFAVHLERREAQEGLLHRGQRLALTERGWDAVEFLISPNPGEPLKPLARIASGGELSRIMLALKTVLAEVDPVPTLVFDEIDIGIGGETANALGAKLAHIAQGKQVLCVTHLPHIASRAHHHLSVSKHTKGEHTYVAVEVVEGERRVEEIGRLLSGEPLTEAALRHARELLEGSPTPPRRRVRVGR